jgi:hypothetical protein
LPDEIAEGWDLAVGDVEPGWSIVYAGHELWFPQRVLRVDVVSDDWQRVWTIGDDSTRHVWRSTRACDLDNGFVTGWSCDDRPVLRWLPEGPWWPLQTEPLSEHVRRFVLNTFGIAVECPECGQFGTSITHGTAPEMPHLTRAGHSLRPGEPDYRCECGHSWSVDEQGRVDVPGRSPDDAAADDDDPSDALDYGALSPSETEESSDFFWEVRECLLEEAGGPWDQHGPWGETLDVPLCTWFWGSEVDLEQERQGLLSAGWPDPDDDYWDTDPPSTPDEIAAASLITSRRKLGENPATPVEVLRALAADENKGVRSAVGENPVTPVDVLRALAADDDEYVRSGVGGNLATPVDVLRALAADDAWYVRKILGENPATPVDVLRALAADNHEWVRSGVSMNPATPVEVLRALATDNDEHVRAGVSRNLATPFDVLHTLATDADEDVCLAVSHNPVVPVDVIRALATCAYDDVRCVVGGNPATPIDVLRALAFNDGGPVRCVVGGNPAAPVDVLHVLATDQNWEVRLAVSENPAVPVEVLRALATDQNWEVRLAVTQNPAVPVEVLRILATDRNEYVRGAVGRAEAKKEPASREGVSGLDDDARDLLDLFDCLDDLDSVNAPTESDGDLP